jgi:hypothetical protein
MKLEIPIKYDNAYNCVDNLVVAIAKWWNKEYALMSAEAWEFSYKPIKLDNSETIGNNVTLNERSNYDYLLEYHGIKTTYIEAKDYLEVLEVIKSELSQNRPVVIYMDTYWCHWYSELYKELHRPHFCLVTDMDDKGLFISDIQMANKGAILPIDEFMKGFRSYVTFLKVDIDTKEIGWKEMLEKGNSKLLFS